MIEVKNLNKKIKGIEILKKMNYKFKPGNIYGLYGHNGSGKTMLLRALAGLIIPDSGEILYNDKLLHKDFSFPPNVGIIIENMEMLPNYTGFKNLEMLGQIKKVATKEDITLALKRVGLDPDLKKTVKKYSLGMKQRLNIAQAIFEKPDYLFLDEPTNALDEEGVKLIYNILREERDRGVTIIIASHNKEDIFELCNECVRVYEGELRYE